MKFLQEKAELTVGFVLKHVMVSSALAFLLGVIEGAILTLHFVIPYLRMK